MTQALQTEGLVPYPKVLKSKMHILSCGKIVQYAVMVVRNSIAYPQMLQKKALVARAVAVTMVPETPPGDQDVRMGRMNLRTLIHPVWLLDKGKVSCSKN